MYKLRSFLLLLGIITASPAIAAPVNATASTSVISKSRQGTITFNTTGSIVRATINNPPVNLVDSRVSSDLFDFLTSLDPSHRSPSSPAPKVVIFSSGNPDIFLCHLDVNQLVLPTTPAKQAFGQQWVTIGRLLQSLTSTMFIAEIDGVGWGAGQELPVQMDLRYAGPKAYTGFVENILGVDAGTGGQLFLGPLVGKARALEFSLAAKGFDGPTGTAAGLFNAHYRTREELRRAVDDMANRIAGRTSESINGTKSALARELNPTIAEQDQNVADFSQLIVSDKVQTFIKKYLKASNNQTSVEFERAAPESYLAVARS